MESDQEEGRVLYYRDEDGKRQDVGIHEPFINDPESDLYFVMATIRDHVEAGDSFEDALELFGTEELQAAVASGQIGEEELMNALIATEAELEAEE